MSDGHDGHHDEAPVRIEPGSEDERILNSVLHPGGEHYTDRFFFWIFVWLAIITVVEIFVTFVEFVALNRFLLVGLGIGKFALVVMYFMHLKGDNKLYQMLFVGPLLLSIAILVSVIALFNNF